MYVNGRLRFSLYVKGECRKKHSFLFLVRKHYGVAKAFEGKTNQECYDLVVKTLNRLAQPYAEEINQLHANNQVNQPENQVNQPENQENPPA